MLSKYFRIKTATKKFEEDFLRTIDEIKDKKVILYGADDTFIELNKKYPFKEKLNIVAIADEKFEKGSGQIFKGIKTIAPDDIVNQDYETILITKESARPIISYLQNKLKIENKDFRSVFIEEILDEAVNLNYLYKMNFDKNFSKLVKKLKNKTVLIYGAGLFFELIKKYFDITGLNIIGVSDKRFSKHEENEAWNGYRVFAPEEIKQLNPDYVLVATKFYINIIESLYYETLKNTKIKVKPLLMKPFLTLIKEIWG